MADTHLEENIANNIEAKITADDGKTLVPIYQAIVDIEHAYSEKVAELSQKLAEDPQYQKLAVPEDADEDKFNSFSMGDPIYDYREFLDARHALRSKEKPLEEEKDCPPEQYRVFHPECVFIIGPGAVGKMSVGQAIADKLGYVLIHNHTFIEPVLKMLNGQNNWELVSNLRETAFEYFAANDRPIITTNVISFDSMSDFYFMMHLQRFLTDIGFNVYLVELESSLQTRIARNRTPQRLREKPSKNNFEASEGHIREKFFDHQANTWEEGLLKYWCLGKKWIKVNNEDLSPEAAADIIIDNLELKRWDRGY